MKNWMITFSLRMKGTFSFLSKSSHRTIINMYVYGCFSKLSTCKLKLIKCDVFLHICTLFFCMLDVSTLLFCAAC